MLCFSSCERTAVISIFEWHVDISPCFEQDLDELKIPLALEAAVVSGCGTNTAKVKALVRAGADVNFPIKNGIDDLDIAINFHCCC
jgi:hypothetical protein